MRSLTVTLTLTICAFLAASASATTIIGVQTADEFAIAADSLGSYGEAFSPESTCKIFVVNNAAFAMSGLLRHRDTGFDAEAIVAEILWRRRSITRAADEIAQRLSRDLEIELPRAQKTNPKAYAWMLQRRILTDVLIGAFEADHPVVVQIRVSMAKDDAGGIAITAAKRSCPQDCQAGRMRFSLGLTEAIDRHLAQSDTLRTEKPLHHATRLVQLEIDAKTPGVGGPVDSIRITRHGIVWDGKAMCTGLPDGFKPPAS
jgi:hypothetical protein